MIWWYDELQIYPPNHLNLNGSVERIQPHIARTMKKVIDRTNYILDTILTGYTKQAFSESSRSFTIYGQCLWANLRDGDSEGR